MYILVLWEQNKDVYNTVRDSINITAKHNTFPKENRKDEKHGNTYTFTNTITNEIYYMHYILYMQMNLNENTF